MESSSTYKGSAREGPVNRLQREESVENEIVLTPQRRSFVSGCQGIQKSSVQNQNSSLDDLPILTGRRAIGSGRLGNLATNDLPLFSNSRRIPSTLDDSSKFGNNTGRLGSFGLHHSGMSNNSNSGNTNNGGMVNSNRRNQSNSNAYSGNAGRYSRNSHQYGGYRMNNGHYHRRDVEEEEPEWFSEGPTSQHDTIELVGFESSENGCKEGRKGNKEREREDEEKQRRRAAAEQEEERRRREDGEMREKESQQEQDQQRESSSNQSDDISSYLDAILCSQELPGSVQDFTTESKFSRFFKTEQHQQSSQNDQKEQQNVGPMADLVRLLMNANINVDSGTVDSNAQEKLKAISGRATSLEEIEAGFKQPPPQQTDEQTHFKKLLSGMGIHAGLPSTATPPPPQQQQKVVNVPQIVVFDQQHGITCGNKMPSCAPPPESTNLLHQIIPQAPKHTPPRIPSPLLLTQAGSLIGCVPPLSPGAAVLTPPPGPVRVPSPQELAVHTQNILHNALIKKILEEQNKKSEKQIQNHQQMPLQNGLAGSHQSTATMPSFMPTQVIRKLHHERQSADDPQMRMPRPIVKSGAAPQNNISPEWMHKALGLMSNGTPNEAAMSARIMVEQQQRMLFAAQQSQQLARLEQQRFALAAAAVSVAHSRPVQQQQQPQRRVVQQQQQMASWHHNQQMRQQQPTPGGHSSTAASSEAMFKWFGSAVLEAGGVAPPVPRHNALSVEELERQHTTATVNN